MHGETTTDIAMSGEKARRRLLSVDQVAHTLSIGRRQVYRLLDAGRLESVWIGRRRLVLATSVDAYVEQLRAEAEQRQAVRAAA